MWRSVLVLSIVLACKSQSKETPATVASGSAPPIDAAPLTLAGQLAKLADELKLPGVEAATWRDGQLLAKAQAGDVPQGAKWHLGSNTKAMTALLIGIYVDKGTLRWTDTIGQIFAGVKGMKIDPGYKAVTLDQLVRHEGGAPAEEPPAVWSQLRLDGDAPDARIKYVRAILEQPPAQAPGTYVYANANYVIAGAMLEQKTGKRWEDLMKTDVFAKLQMDSCGFGAPAGEGQLRGHKPDGTPVEPGPLADNPPGLGPAGTVHCSLYDYGKFLDVFARGVPDIVTPETLQHLRTPRGEGPNAYAGGWRVVPSPLGITLAHTGSNTMWHVIALVVPEKKLAFAIATNKYEPKLESKLRDLFAQFGEK